MSKLLKAWYNEPTEEYFTCKIRLAYPALIEPQVNKKFPNNPAQFSTSGLVPKGGDISVIQQAVIAFAERMYGANWKDKEVKLPIKKTAAYDKLAEYADEYPLFIRTSANVDFPPILFAANLAPFDKTRRQDIYGGRWAVLALNLWGPKPEKKDINRFVSLGLKRVQLLDHDDVIASGRITTPDGFEAVSGGAVSGGTPGAGTSADDLWA